MVLYCAEPKSLTLFCKLVIRALSLIAHYQKHRKQQAVLASVSVLIGCLASWAAVVFVDIECSHHS